MRQAPSPPAALTVPQTPLDHPSLPRYPAYGGFFAGIYLIYHCKPLEALDIKYWARPRAQKELEQDMRMMDKLRAGNVAEAVRMQIEASGLTRLAG